MDIESIAWPQFLQIINDKQKALKFVPKVENSQSFTKDIVNFANSKGGMVIIGFDQNNYQLPGVKFDKRWLIAVIKNECKPEPECLIKEVVRNLKRVYVIEVTEGTQKPYNIFSVSYVLEATPEKEPEKITTESLMLDQLHNESVRKRHKKCLEFMKNNPGITNAQYRTINAVSHKTAHNELSFMVKSGILRTVGQGRSTKYVLADSADEVVSSDQPDMIAPAELENADSHIIEEELAHGNAELPIEQIIENESEQTIAQKDDLVTDNTAEEIVHDEKSEVMITGDDNEDNIEQPVLFDNMGDDYLNLATSRTELRLSEAENMSSHVNNDIFDTDFGLDEVKIEEHNIFSR